MQSQSLSMPYNRVQILKHTVKHNVAMQVGVEEHGSGKQTVPLSNGPH